MLDHVLEHGHVELIDDLLAHSSGDDEVRMPEHGEVPGDGGPGGVKVLGDLAGGTGPVAQEAEDVPAGGVGEGAEGFVHAVIS